MAKFPLKEIQSTWTRRPTANSSCPYVEIALGDVAAQCTMQLQLEQVGPGPLPSFHSLGSSLDLARGGGVFKSWLYPQEHPAQCRGHNYKSLWCSSKVSW